MHPLLYAITPADLDDAQLLEKSAEVLRGGCQWLQYRDKSGDPKRRERQARALLSLCHEHHAKLIINDDLELALHINADGVHLGQDDGNHNQVRHLLGTDKIFGVTCHDSLTLARKAIAQGASYIAFGRFFASNTKPHAKPAPLTLIREARAEFGEQQICVIGGINQTRAQILLNEGADTLAVSEALFGTDNTEKATRDLLSTITPSSLLSASSCIKDFL